MNNKIVYKFIKPILISFFVYLMLDVPFRLIEFLGSPSVGGIKNMLPVTLGLIFGEIAAVGIGLAIIIGNIVTATLGFNAIVEIIVTMIVTCLAYHLWYMKGVSSYPSTKKTFDIFKFVGIAVLIGIISGFSQGIIISIIEDKNPIFLSLEIAAHYVSWSLLVGLPIIILLTSVYGVIPYIPREYMENHSLSEIYNIIEEYKCDISCIGEISDKIDMFNLENNVDTKKAYYLMFCLEELNIKIIENMNPEDKIKIYIKNGEAILVEMEYKGKPYNPLNVKKIKGDLMFNMEIEGILLMKEMAIVARYRYRDGINKIKFVV